MTHHRAHAGQRRGPVKPLPQIRRATQTRRVCTQRLDDLPISERHRRRSKTRGRKRRAPAPEQPRRDVRRRPPRILAPPPSPRVTPLPPISDRRRRTLKPRPPANRVAHLLRRPVRPAYRQLLRTRLAHRSPHHISLTALAHRRPQIAADRPRVHVELACDRATRHPRRVQPPRGLDALCERQLKRRPIHRQAPPRAARRARTRDSRPPCSPTATADSAPPTADSAAIGAPATSRSPDTTHTSAAARPPAHTNHAAHPTPAQRSTYAQAPAAPSSPAPPSRSPARSRRESLALPPRSRVTQPADLRAHPAHLDDARLRNGRACDERQQADDCLAALA